MADVKAVTLLVLLLALIAVCGAEDFYTGTDVIELTASNFRSKVLEDDHIWMVEFYAPWCGHCQRLKPDYIKAATASKGIVRFGAINCDDHRSIASEYGVKGFPTLKLFGVNKKRYEDYNGARTPKAMADAALALLPNHVTVVTEKTHSDFLSSTPELPKALLFTSKSSTTALYKALALDFKGRMVLGEVRAKKDAPLLDTYGVQESELPVLLVLPLEAEGEEAAGAGKHPKYEGELRHKPLFKFLSQYAKAKPGKESGKEGKKGGAESSAAKEKAAETPKKPQEPAVAELVSVAAVEAKCLKVKGFCVIALFQGEDAAQLKDEVSQFGALEEKYHKDPLKFSYVSLAKVPGFKSTFLSGGEEGQYPAVVLLSPKRSKFAVHWGFDDLESVLDRAIGGDVSLESKLEDDWHKSLEFA